jgi:gliding motility-associated-like protein
VSQPPAIVLNTQAEDVNCFGGNDGLAVVTGLSNANLPVGYAWSNGGTGSQVTSLVAGTYTVTVTDTKGCTAMKSFVIEQPPTLDLSFTQEPLLCATEQTASIEATIQGGMATYNYAWSNGGTTGSISQLGAGVYVLTVTDQNGCTVTGSQTIVLPDSLRLDLQMTPPECFGERNGRIKLLVSGGQIPYRYSLNGGEFGGSSTFIALTAGIYTLQVRDANGCITALTDTLDQPPAIVVQLPADTTLVLGDSLLLSSTITQAVGNVTYAWSSTYVDSLTCVDVLFCDEIWVKPAISNIYQLMVTDENGCVGKASIAVKIEKPRGVYVPTAFSPNGDFTNDLLVVHGLSKQVRNILTFRIFDRWGELIYEDKNFTVNQLDRGWDGQFRGQPVDPGVFVWVLEAEYIDGHRDILKGNVTLIR